MYVKMHEICHFMHKCMQICVYMLIFTVSDISIRTFFGHKYSYAPWFFWVLRGLYLGLGGELGPNSGIFVIPIQYPSKNVPGSFWSILHLDPCFGPVKVVPWESWNFSQKSQFRCKIGGTQTPGVLEDFGGSDGFITFIYVKKHDLKKNRGQKLNK